MLEPLIYFSRNHRFHLTGKIVIGRTVSRNIRSFFVVKVIFVNESHFFIVDLWDIVECETYF